MSVSNHAPPCPVNSVWDLEAHWCTKDISEQRKQIEAIRVVSYCENKYKGYNDFVSSDIFPTFKAGYEEDLRVLEDSALTYSSYSQYRIRTKISDFKRYLFTNILGNRVDDNHSTKCFRVKAFGDSRINLHSALWQLRHHPHITHELRVQVVNELIDALEPSIDKVEVHMAIAVAMLQQNQHGAHKQITNAKKEIAQKIALKLARNHLPPPRLRRSTDNTSDMCKCLLANIAVEYNIPHYKQYVHSHGGIGFSPELIKTFREQLELGLSKSSIFEFIVDKYLTDFLLIVCEFDAPTADDVDEFEAALWDEDKREKFIAEIESNLIPPLAEFVGNSAAKGLLNLYDDYKEFTYKHLLPIEFFLKKEMATGFTSAIYGSECDKACVKVDIDNSVHGTRMNVQVVSARGYFTWLEIDQKAILAKFEHLIWVQKMCFLDEIVKRDLLKQIFSGPVYLVGRQAEYHLEQIFEFISAFKRICDFKVLFTEELGNMLNQHLFPRITPKTADIKTCFVTTKVMDFINEQTSTDILPIFSILIEFEMASSDDFDKKEHLVPVLDVLVKTKLLLNCPLSNTELHRIYLLFINITNRYCQPALETQWIDKFSWENIGSANREQLLGIAVLTENTVILNKLLKICSPNVMARFFYILNNVELFTDKMSLLKLAVNSKDCFNILINHPKIDINNYCTARKQTILHEVLSTSNTDLLSLLLTHPNTDVFIVNTFKHTALSCIYMYLGVEKLTDWFALQCTRSESEALSSSSEASMSFLEDDPLGIGVDGNSFPLQQITPAVNEDWTMLDNTCMPLKRILTILTTNSKIEKLYPLFCEVCENQRDLKKQHLSILDAKILLELWLRHHCEQYEKIYYFLSTLTKDNLGVLLFIDKIVYSRESHALVIKAKLTLEFEFDVEEQVFFHDNFEYLQAQNFIAEKLKQCSLKTNNFSCVLLSAMKYDNQELVKSLLYKIGNKDFPYVYVIAKKYDIIGYQCKPLIYCLGLGCSQDMLKLILKLRPNDIFKNKELCTRVAFVKKQYDLLSVLLEHVKTTFATRFTEFLELQHSGRTALKITIDSHNRQATKLLAEAGADIFFCDSCHVNLSETCCLPYLPKMIGVDKTFELLREEASKDSNVMSKIFKPSNVRSLSGKLRWLNVKASQANDFNTLNSLFNQFFNLVDYHDYKLALGCILEAHLQNNFAIFKEIQARIKNDDQTSDLQRIIGLLGLVPEFDKVKLEATKRWFAKGKIIDHDVWMHFMRSVAKDVTLAYGLDHDKLHELIIQARHLNINIDIEGF